MVTQMISVATLLGPVMVPNDASYFAKMPRFPEYEQLVVDSIQRLVAGQNDVARGNFSDACRDWLTANAINRDEKLPLAAKPVAPAEIVVKTVVDTSGGTYVWQEDGAPLGVCPDLPALPQVHPQVSGPVSVMNVPAGDTLPLGFITVDPQGQKWQKQSSGTPWGVAYFYARVAMLLVMLAVFAGSVRAQVTIKFTPEPMAVPVAAIASARDLGRWQIEGCSEAAAPITLAAERISMAAENIRFLDWDDALLVLMGHAKRSFWGQVAHWGPIVGQGLAAGLNLGGVIKGPAAIALSVGSQVVVPQVVTIAQGEVPSVAPLTSQIRYPITLQPGGCFTDHRFAGKMKNPQPVVIKVP